MNRWWKDSRAAASSRAGDWPTVAELHAFFAYFTGTEDGHSSSSDPSIDRALQRVLGGPLNQASDAESGLHRIETSGIVGNPVGPDNNMVHYNMGYVGEDSRPLKATIGS